jgi:hypothetical protein
MFDDTHPIQDGQAPDRRSEGRIDAAKAPEREPRPIDEHEQPANARDARTAVTD